MGKQCLWGVVGLGAILTVLGGISSAPEPGTLVLLGSGLVGLGEVGRKKVRK